MSEESCIRFPVLGEPAPDFEAETTHGLLKLSDLKGKWVVMFSHPADFTPVCTTEFMAFAGIFDELKALNVYLVGLSVDSISAHLAWVHAIKEKMGVSVPFPIIADLNMKVANKYTADRCSRALCRVDHAVFVCHFHVQVCDDGERNRHTHLLFDRPNPRKVC